MHNDSRGISLFFVLVALAMVSVMSTHAFAREGLQSPSQGAAKKQMHWAQIARQRPARFRKRHTGLHPADQVETLAAVQMALERVGDGQSYVWDRPEHRLHAIITPLSSWRHPNGDICRKISLSLALGDYAKRTKTIACRNKQHIWKLKG